MRYIACDFDGTLADYNSDLGDQPVINKNLIPQIIALRQGGDQGLIIVTNQAGLAYCPQRYAPPKINHFVNRLLLVIHDLTPFLRVVRVQVSLYHEKATPDSITYAYGKLMDRFSEHLHPVNWTIYTTREYRKPEAGMLLASGANDGYYFGDSPEDEIAVERANHQGGNWIFVSVPRFEPKGAKCD